MEKIKEKYEITRQNYINMKKRLEANLKFYNFVLTFGSLYLIILGITDISFEGVLNSKLLSFISLVQSIILFTVSLVIRPDDTRDKIENLRNGILELNTIIEKINSSSETMNDEYQILMRKMIVREDIDYYHTAKLLNERIKIEEYKKDMEEILKSNIMKVQMFWYFFRYLIYIIILILITLALFL